MGIYCGGSERLMGAIADAVFAESGKVIGVAAVLFIASARTHNRLTICAEGPNNFRPSR